MTDQSPEFLLTRRSMLEASAVAAGSLLGLPVASGGSIRSPRAEHVILFWNGGGMSHLDTWDPKPGSSARGEFAAIDTSAPGVRIAEILPRLSRQMHHCALIRSVVGTEGAHGPAVYNMQTGCAQTEDVMHPSLGSVVAHSLPQRGDVPSFVSISGRALPGSSLGPQCEGWYVPSPGDSDPRLAYPEGPAGHSSQLSREALDAFRFGDVGTATLRRYGDTTFGRGALLAKRLVEAGVRCVQVHRGGFDTHRDNFRTMRSHGEVMDAVLAALVEDLADSGLLQKTLVVMLSEFGRTPHVNMHAGRDHWHSCFSCLLAGGGIAGGNVIGSSDRDGYEPADRPVTVSDLHATIYRALGVTPGRRRPNGRQLPNWPVADGEPVTELFV